MVKILKHRPHTYNRMFFYRGSNLYVNSLGDAKFKMDQSIIKMHACTRISTTNHGLTRDSIYLPVHCRATYLEKRDAL